MHDSNRRAIGCAFSAFLVVSTLSAQMQFEWSTRFAAPGLPSTVTKSVMHDFGYGPVPVVALSDQLMRFDGHGWVTIGPALGGSVYDLASFQSQLIVSAPASVALNLPPVFR